MRGRPELAVTAARIEARAGDVLGRLGYGPAREPSSPPEGFGVARLLGHDGAFALPRDLALAAGTLDPLDDPRVEELLDLARTLATSDFTRARMPAHEARTMLDALATLSSAHDAALRGRLQAMRGDLADGGNHHARQIGALLRSRRRAAFV